jgi:hypothetical protein
MTKSADLKVPAVVPLVMIGFAIAVALLFPGRKAPAIVPPSAVKTSDSDLLAFKYEVQAAFERGQKQQLEAIESQKDMLERIEQSVQQLIDKSEAVEVTKPAVVEVVNPPVYVPAPRVTVMESPPVVRETIVATSTPVRMSSTRWNVQGNWNYSASEIADHLRTTHGVNPAGKSLSEMTAMHDNLHNGYAAYGRVSQPTASVVTTTKSTTRYATPRRTRLFSRGYSNCPGGVCPTP